MTHKNDEYAVILDPDALRDRRQELGLSLRQVAEVSGLQSHTYLYALEAGRRHTCSAALAVRLALTLRLTPLQMQRMFEFRRQVRAA